MSDEFDSRRAHHPLGGGAQGYICGAVDLEHLLYGHTDIVLEDANVASEMGEVPKRHVLGQTCSLEVQASGVYIGCLFTQGT